MTAYPPLSGDKSWKKKDFEFKIEFLLPFTGCRKMLGKMPGILLFWQ